MVMTRPRAAAQAFVAGLDAETRAALDVTYSPLIEIVSLDVPVSLIPDDGAIFTSSNGVQYAPDGAGRVAYCVGQATTRAARTRGWAAIQAGQDAISLRDEIIRISPRQRLFHLSGRHTRGAISEHLSDAGLSVQNIAIYDQITCAMTDGARAVLARGNRVIVPLFSPRSAIQFAIQAPHTSSVHVVALSDAVAEQVDREKLSGLTVVQSPDAKAMGIAIADLL